MPTRTEFLWAPTILPVSLGVALWISAFDINYARMDMESDQEHGIHSFPSRFGDKATTRTTVQLTLLWFACFAIADPMSGPWFLLVGIHGIRQHRRRASKERFADFQTMLFRVSMLTGWVLLASLALGFAVEPHVGLTQNGD